MIFLLKCKNTSYIYNVNTVKSPAFTHLAATIRGLSTVRAFNSQEILRKEFDHLQDTHSACWYMSISTTTTFGFALDFICTLFVASMLSYYMLLDTGASSNEIGLVISQAIGLSGLVQWGMKMFTKSCNFKKEIRQKFHHKKKQFLSVKVFVRVQRSLII